MRSVTLILLAVAALVAGVAASRRLAGRAFQRIDVRLRARVRERMAPSGAMLQTLVLAGALTFVALPALAPEAPAALRLVLGALVLGPLVYTSETLAVRLRGDGLPADVVGLLRRAAWLLVASFAAFLALVGAAQQA
jgi:hypothetical protein